MKPGCTGLRNAWKLREMRTDSDVKIFAYEKHQEMWRWLQKEANVGSCFLRCFWNSTFSPSFVLRNHGQLKKHDCTLVLHKSILCKSTPVIVLDFQASVFSPTGTNLVSSFPTDASSHWFVSANLLMAVVFQLGVRIPKVRLGVHTCCECVYEWPEWLCMCVCQGTGCEHAIWCQRAIFYEKDQMLLMVNFMFYTCCHDKKNKRKQNLSPKQLLWPLFFQLQMTVRMKNAKENICVFFFLLFLSHIYEELLSYAPVKLSGRLSVWWDVMQPSVLNCLIIEAKRKYVLEHFSWNIKIMHSLGKKVIHMWPCVIFDFLNATHSTYLVFSLAGKWLYPARIKGFQLG